MSQRLGIPHPGPSTRPFDFDGWAELARADPEGFELHRRAVIEAAIGSAPESRRRRLRGVQFRVDMERRRWRSPLAACIRLSAMMWGSVLGSDGLQAHLSALSAALAAQPGSPMSPAPRRSRPVARVLPFRRRTPPAG